jgi:hypothetical protein
VADVAPEEFEQLAASEDGFGNLGTELSQTV